MKSSKRPGTPATNEIPHVNEREIIAAYKQAIGEFLSQLDVAHRMTGDSSDPVVLALKAMLVAIFERTLGKCRTIESYEMQQGVPCPDPSPSPLLKELSTLDSPSNRRFLSALVETYAACLEVKQERDEAGANTAVYIALLASFDALIKGLENEINGMPEGVKI